MNYRNDSTVRLIQHMGSDAHIASAAWVSSSEAEGLQRAGEKPEDVSGCINYLMAHRHGTPFEHNAMTFYVEAPIFVWREFQRHRIGFSYNEESARYKALKPVFFIPHRDRPMMKVGTDEKPWKPGRPKFERCESDAVYNELCENLKASYARAYNFYVCNLQLNIDPGLARDCLPVGIYSSCWVTCNTRSLMAFLSLRTHEPKSLFVSYPLAEIEEVARKLESILAELFPITHAAFNKNDRRVGP